MDNGWIKIHRQIKDWEWYTNANTMRVFIHLLLTANWEDKRWQGIEVKKGQRIISLSRLAQECGLSIRSLRTSLNHLKSTHEIAHEGHRNFSIITINKFDEYQSTDTQVDTQQTNDRQTTDNNIRNKEIKNNKNKEDIGENSPTPSEIMKDFVMMVEENGERLEQFACTIAEQRNLEVAEVRAELAKFVNYWCEKTKSGRKQLWETKPTFEVQRRLDTWFTRKEQNRFTGFKAQPKIFSFVS